MELNSLSGPSEGIALETQEGNPITNDQSREIWNRDEKEFERYEDKYGDVTIKRTEPDAGYNCHGLTFGSRRTWIYDSDDLQMIISDDCYHEVDDSEVLPGDILLYIDESGDIEHSGIVAKLPSPDDVLSIPTIFRKWGKYAEILHKANQCPYNYGRHQYYRKLS